MTKTLKDMGYMVEDFEVYPFGVNVNIDVEYGHTGVNIGYEEICAIKLEMEELQNETK